VPGVGGPAHRRPRARLRDQVAPGSVIMNSCAPIPLPPEAGLPVFPGARPGDRAAGADFPRFRQSPDHRRRRQQSQRSSPRRSRPPASSLRRRLLLHRPFPAPAGVFHAPHSSRLSSCITHHTPRPERESCRRNQCLWTCGTRTATFCSDRPRPRSAGCRAGA
jgi:hypothetical protein